MKILVVLPRFPYPLDKGDKLRAYHQIKHLSLRNEVYLFCVSHTIVPEQDIDQLRPYCKDIRVVHLNRLTSIKNVVRNFVHSKSLQIGYWDSKKSRRAYKSFEAEIHPDVLYSQMVRTIPLVARSSVPKVMDFQDALSMNTERRMDSVRKGFWHWVLHFEFKMLRSTEYNSFKIFDDLVIISETDSDAIPHHKNSDINIIPNGVDFDYYQPRERTKDFDLVFCGNMQYAPNVHAVQYLVHSIMPLVWKKLPNTRLLISGTSPKPAVLKLASDKVVVGGRVDDIRDSYSQAKVFVAPMTMGSGLQNKLLEAMAMRLPCVTTSLANDSLGAVHGESILVGNTPQEFADQIVTLLSNPDQLSAIAAAGYDYVHQNYSWTTFVDKLENVLSNVVRK